MAVVPAEIFKCLHASRLAHYRVVANGQDADALALYEWNIELASALQDPLGITEVAVRHAIDTQLCTWAQQHVNGPDWIDHIAHIPHLSVPGVFTTTRHKLYKAADQSRRSRPGEPPTARGGDHPRRSGGARDVWDLGR